ncbi:hypothetical protein MG293_020361 [Ovis ammon polii]|uniref:Uncharacterized protein n=1 Tax=Ovis ammon polii TaxID=230172 RepID=A0AAD4TKA9_OVIAM|nr:hypothetical protein MG293_020361 [Ovis ammon polii]
MDTREAGKSGDGERCRQEQNGQNWALHVLKSQYSNFLLLRPSSQRRSVVLPSQLPCLGQSQSAVWGQEPETRTLSKKAARRWDDIVRAPDWCGAITVMPPLAPGPLQPGAQMPITALSSTDLAPLVICPLLHV